MLPQNMIKRIKNPLPKPNKYKRTKSKEELDKEYINYCVSMNTDPIFMKSKDKDKNEMLKRCMECNDFINSKYMVFCIYCRDAYHSYCYSPPLLKIPENKFCIICKLCNESLPNGKNNNDININDNKCNKCNKLLNPSVTIIVCEKCHKKFHRECFKHNKTKIICERCERIIEDIINKKEVINFFNTNTNINNNKFLNKKHYKEDDEMSKEAKVDFDIYQKISKKIPKVKISKVEGHLKLPKKPNKEQKQKMLNSLFRALQVKGITFSDDLVFIDSDCPSEMNTSTLEPGLIEISRRNKQVFNEFKKRSRNGEYTPLEIIDDPIQKFIVRATENIQMNTIICEYTGEVTLLRKTVFDENDSIMELIRTPSANTSLVICPKRYANIARFLSGVNNYDSKLKKKQNVYSIKVSINRKVHILLLAMRYIKKGEILYYDYNAGGYNEYPTENFI